MERAYNVRLILKINDLRWNNQLWTDELAEATIILSILHYSQANLYHISHNIKTI